MERLYEILEDMQPEIDFHSEKALIDDHLLDSLSVLALISELEDEFDAVGMAEAQEKHKKNFLTLARQMRLLYPECLPLSAGTCTICRTCSYPERPCRFPAKMLSSMEAYGILVSEVCTQAGLKYYYGPKTLTYSSCILWKEGMST